MLSGNQVFVVAKTTSGPYNGLEQGDEGSRRGALTMTAQARLRQEKVIP